MFERLSVSERRTLPPAIAVSTVAFALRPPEDARIPELSESGRPDSVRPEPGFSERGGPEPASAAGGSAEPLSGTTLWIPLVRRTRAPFEGRWALPGGPTEWHETLSDTALRTVHDAVHRAPGYLEQLYAFGAVERSAEAQRLVTIAYWALYGERELARDPSLPARPRAEGPSGPRRWDEVPAGSTPKAGSVQVGSAKTGLAKTLARLEAQRRSAEGNAAEGTGGDSGAGAGSADTGAAGTGIAGMGAAAAGERLGGLRPDPNVAWFSADRLPELAFDHAEIIAYALWRLRVKTEYASVAHRFLGPEFTLAQLRRVHEAIRGAAVDPANFRRQMLASGELVDTGELLTGTPHRPAKLYRFAEAPDAEPRSGPRPPARSAHPPRSAPHRPASPDEAPPRPAPPHPAQPPHQRSRS